MPQIPIIVNRARIEGQQMPSAGPDYFGAGIGRELERSAQVFQNIQDGYDAAEGAKLIGEGTAGLDGVLMDAKTKISDPEEYKSFTDSKIADVYGATLEKAPNERVRRAVEAKLADNKGVAEKQAQFGYFEKKRDVARGDMDIAFDQMSKAAAAAPDEQTRNSTYRTFAGLLGTMKASNYLTSEQVAEKSLQFDKSVLTARANALMKGDANAFLAAADAGEFDRLGGDVVLKFREGARLKLEQDERRTDAATRKIKEASEQDWYSRLAQDQLTDSEIETAIKGEHPYITPQKAIEFKNKKESGTALIGGDSTGVKAIMEEYYSGPSSFKRISQARAALQAFRSGSNSSNPLVSKAFNELQADERQMIGIGMSQANFATAQTNQAITAAKESYEGNVPATGIPFLDKLRTQNKAKVGEAVRRGQDPTPLIKGNADRQKARIDAIPPQRTKVLDLAK